MSLILSYFYYSLEENICISRVFWGRDISCRVYLFFFLFGVCFCFFFFEGMKVYEKHRARVSVLETHSLFQLILRDSCTCFSYSVPIWGVVRNRFLDLCFWTFLV